MRRADNFGRQLVGEASQIERVERIGWGAAVAALGVRNKVQVVLAGVDDRRGSDADVRSIVVAAERVGHGRPEVIAQQNRAGIGVDGINRVVAGDDIYDVVESLVISCRDGNVRDQERLRIHLIVYGHSRQQAELRGVHVRGRESGFSIVPARAVVVIVICGYGCLRCDCAGKKKREDKAGNSRQPTDVSSAM